MESIPVMLYQKCIVICWFINWIPSTAGKKSQNKEADHFENHSKSETLISKEIYIWRLPWATTRRVIFSPTHWHLKSLYRIFNWVWTHAQSKRSQKYLIFSKLCPWNNVLCGNSRQCTSKDREGNETVITHMGQLIFTFSCLPPPTPYYIPSSISNKI